MFKEAKGLSLILVLTTGLWGCFLSFAQSTGGTETLTITTYYPSPFGSYDKLRTNKLVIGDPDASSTPSPDTDGVLRFKGRGSDPIGADDTKPGALYYNTTDNEFKYHDGSGWQALGGGGGCFTYYCNTVAPNQCIDHGGTQGYCPAGFKEKYALGSWGWCGVSSGSGFSFFRSPGGGCGGLPSHTIGQAYVCCK